MDYHYRIPFRIFSVVNGSSICYTTTPRDCSHFQVTTERRYWVPTTILSENDNSSDYRHPICGLFPVHHGELTVLDSLTLMTLFAVPVSSSVLRTGCLYLYQIICLTVIPVLSTLMLFPWGRTRQPSLVPTYWSSGSRWRDQFSVLDHGSTTCTPSKVWVLGDWLLRFWGRPSFNFMVSLYEFLRKGGGRCFH